MPTTTPNGTILAIVMLSVIIGAMLTGWIIAVRDRNRQREENKAIYKDFEDYYK